MFTRTTATSAAPRLVAVGLLLAGLAGLGAQARAQSAFSGSASYVAQVRGLRAAGAATSQVGFGNAYSAEILLGAPTTGPGASANHDLWAGLATVPGQVLKGTPPVVFRLEPDADDKLGGATVTVTGFGLAWPSSGPLNLELGGQPVPPVVPDTNTQASFVAPAGEAALVDLLGSPIEGNPLGSVPLQVTTLAGTTETPDAFAYLPALAADCPPVPGEVLELAFRSEGGALASLVAGLSTPGVGLPIPGLAGALEVFTGLSSLGAGTPGPDGGFLFALPVPDQPTLIGKTFLFQAASIESTAPFAGAFTNVLELVVEAGGSQS